MTTSASARQRILKSIRVSTSAIAAVNPSEESKAHAPLAEAYIRHGKLDRTTCLQLMIERLREYEAEVVECSPEQLGATIKDKLLASGKRTFVVPAGLPGAWRAAGFDWMIDDGHGAGRGLAANEIEKTEGVVTASFCGVADSGTIILHHSAQEGRRVLTLLPDWHLCILLASHVVETLPEYFDRCAQPPTLATYISGPSATADIEMTRIKGVHGPRFLHVILARDEPKVN